MKKHIPINRCAALVGEQERNLMELRVKKSALFQYLLIYIMLLCNSSNFYAYRVDGNIVTQYILIAVMVAFLLLKKSALSKQALTCVSVLLGFTVFVRMLQGGIGLSFWSEMAIKILCVAVAITIDKERFFDRFVKIVFVFATISMLFWGIQLAGVNLAKILFTRFATRNNSVSYDYQGYRTIVNLPGYGQLLYSYLEIYPYRNIGIFSEPGVYQMVINTAICILLFFPQYIEIKPQIRKGYFFILSICLVTTQSTSGYIGYLAILLAMLVKRRTSNHERVNINWKRYAISAIGIGVIVLSVDYLTRGTNSLISVTIISKLFTNANQFSLVAENSTGQYRVASLMMSLQAMVQYPLGMGIEKWNSFYRLNELAGAGGWPFKFGAIMGVVPFVYLMYWIFAPLKRLKGNTVLIILLIFLYFNTAIAQSSAVYPALILIPMYLRTRGEHCLKQTAVSM